MDVLGEKSAKNGDGYFQAQIDCTDTGQHLCSYVLTNFPFIIKNIFQCLTAKQLNSCSRVCKIWQAAAKKVKLSRRPIVWGYFKEEVENESGVKIIVSNVKNFIQNLPVEPSFVLLFCSTMLHDEPVKVFNSESRQTRQASKAERIDMAIFLSRQLPDSCKLCAVTADGVIGSSSNLKETEEMEGILAMSCVCFAEMDQISISQMYLDSDQGNTLACYWNDTAKENDFQFSLIPRERLLRMLVFLCDEPFCSQELSFSLYKIYNHPLVVGGFVDKVICPPTWQNDCTTDVPFLCCVGFGGNNLRVASVILKDDVRDKEEVARVIKTLKDIGLPEDNSLAFMFACVGRGVHHYKERNVESTIFRKFFPNTPLLGLFGNGEVGFQYPLHRVSEMDKDGAENRYKQNQTSYMNSHPPKLYHAYTTVFSLMSFS